MRAVGSTLLRGWRLAVLDFWRPVSVALAVTVDLAEEHGNAPIPGHLRKFVDGGDEQRGQAAVDFFIHRQYRQTFAIGHASR